MDLGGASTRMQDVQCMDVGKSTSMRSMLECFCKRYIREIAMGSMLLINDYFHEKLARLIRQTWVLLSAQWAAGRGLQKGGSSTTPRLRDISVSILCLMRPVEQFWHGKRESSCRWPGILDHPTLGTGWIGRVGAILSNLPRRY